LEDVFLLKNGRVDNADLSTRFFYSFDQMSDRCILINNDVFFFLKIVFYLYNKITI